MVAAMALAFVPGANAQSLAADSPSAARATAGVPVLFAQAATAEQLSQYSTPGRPQQVDGAAAAANDQEGLLRELRQAGEEKFGFEMPTLAIDTGFFNKYVWRGIVLTDDPVMQPALTVDWFGFSLNIWGNMDLTGVNDNRGQFNEVDFTLSYAHQFGPVEASIGVVHYYFPNTAFDQTTEVFAGLALPDVLLSPSVTAYFDVDEADGWYVSADVGHSFELPPLFGRFDCSLDLTGGLGFASSKHNDFYFGVDESGWNDFHSSVSLPVKLNHWLTVTPLVSFTSVIDSSLRRAVVDDDNVVYGVNLTILF